MADQRNYGQVAPFATDGESKSGLPKEYTFGSQKPGDYRPDPSTVAPWIAEGSTSNTTTRSSAIYGANATKATPYSKAKAKVGDSEGKTPWATIESEGTGTNPSPPKKRAEAPFATGY